MNRFAQVLLFLFITMQAHAQQQPYQASVLFRKNKAVLNSEAKKVLDLAVSYTKELPKPKRILIKGYTDSDADSAYNAKLSMDRCISVKNYLCAHGIDSAIIEFLALGEEFPLEDQGTEIQKSKSRRVDIIVTRELKQEQKPDEPKKNEPCSKDTLVTLKYGVIVAVNKCRFEQDPNCLRLELFRYEKNNIKFSKFRMKLGLKNHWVVKDRKVFYKANVSCKDTNCIGKDMKLYIPAYEVREKKFYISKFDSTTGKYIKYAEPKIKNVKKKSYVTFSMRCNPRSCKGCPAGGDDFIIGCGGDPGAGCSCKQSRLKLKNGLRAYNMNVDDYFRNVYFNGDGGVPTLRLMSDTTGITLYDVEKSVLRHGLRRLKNCSEEKWFLFIKYHPRCDVYRKYKFGKRDIRIQQERPWEKK